MIATTLETACLEKTMFYNFYMLLYLYHFYVDNLFHKQIDSYISEMHAKTGNLDANSILRPYKRGLMARCIEIKPVNPKIGQSEIAKGYICHVPPYKTIDRIQNYKVLINQTLPRELKRPHMTSKESSPVIETVRVKTSKKNKWMGGSVYDFDEINVDYLVEILHKNNA